MTELITVSTPDGDKKLTLDRTSGRLVAAGEEEVNATQPLLDILIDEAGWSPEQIRSRPQWRVKASPSGKREWPVDIALFDKANNQGDPDHVLILCECKKPDENSGIEQLKIYLDREPHARTGIWFNGTDHSIVYKTPSGYERAPDGTPIPTPDDPLKPLEAKRLTYKDLRRAPSFTPLFTRIRNKLAAEDSNVNRDEEILPDVSVLLLLKILDEKIHESDQDRPLRFQIDETPEATADRITGFFRAQVDRHPDLFGIDSEDARFRIDDESVHYVVENLQNYQLLTNSRDAVADAFQVLRGKAYKGEEGQYFTPPSVVGVAVAALRPGIGERVIDPACGSGSFLAQALREVADQIAATTKDDEKRRLKVKQWASNNLFAIDKDAVSVRLSKAYLSMLGDGSTHVYKADTIRRSTWTRELQKRVKDGTFDVAITNPPFGTQLKVSKKAGRKEGYEFSKKWKTDDSGDWYDSGEYTSRELGLLFLERCMNLLQPGGRLAIVLPDTYLFSPTYGWLVQWLGKYTITHSINVPIEAFEPHCRAKTSIIVIEKSEPSSGHQIVGSKCGTFGEDKHGRPVYKIVDGQETDERDDEMARSAELIQTPPKQESKLYFNFSQEDAIEKGVLVASYYWRRPYLSDLEEFAASEGCRLVPVGELVENGQLTVMSGHGSPKSAYKGEGPVPYVKVTNLKNWKVQGDPSYGLPMEVADNLRRGQYLEPFDLLTPTRASTNIGLFSVVMPWQTDYILTREIGVWRVADEPETISPWLLLTLLSLDVVHAQFEFLVLMQTNREHLGDHYKELLLPIPRSKKKRLRWSRPVEEYFEATVRAREKYEKLLDRLDPGLFIDRPV